MAGEIFLPVARLRKLPHRTNSSAKLAKTFQDVFLCYKWVHETAGILHRNVSIDCIMYRQLGGKISGTLIDYDLAVDVDRDLSRGESSKQRTGTKPFMARGLLGQQPEVHASKHDLESLFYCYLWMLLQNEVFFLSAHSDTTVHVHPLRHWEDASMFNLKSYKGDMLAHAKLGKTYKEFGLHSYVCDALMRILSARMRMPLESLAEKYGLDPDSIPEEREPASSDPAGISFGDFESRFCGNVMDRLKADITSACLNHRLASPFRVL